MVYLDTEGDDKNDGPGRVIVGGVNGGGDVHNMLPFGFQVCNGAKLQKIVIVNVKLD